MTLTPYELVLLLQIYCGPLTHYNPTAPAYADAISRLQYAGLIRLEMPSDTPKPFQPDNANYHGCLFTEKACVLIERILAMPMPVQTWGYES